VFLRREVVIIASQLTVTGSSLSRSVCACERGALQCFHISVSFLESNNDETPCCYSGS
jgi:hypothetical protein